MPLHARHSTGSLRNLAFFERWSDDELEHFERVAERAAFRSGDVLIREGDSGYALLILIAGEAEVSQGGVFLRRLYPGDHAGMVLAVQPALELQSASYTRFGERGPGSYEPTSCEAHFTHRTLSDALVTSDLRAPRRRLVELRGDDGRRVVGHFPLSSADPDGLVYSIDDRGRKSVLFEGRDDLLRATLIAGLEAMQSGAVPWLASAQFAGVVLARIAEARRMAEAARGPVVTSHQEVADGTRGAVE